MGCGELHNLIGRSFRQNNISRHGSPAVWARSKSKIVLTSTNFEDRIAVIGRLEVLGSLL